MEFIRHFRDLPPGLRGHPPVLATELSRNYRLTSVGDVHVLDRDDLASTSAASFIICRCRTYEDGRPQRLVANVRPRFEKAGAP